MLRQGLFSMEAFIAWEIRRLYLLDVTDCILLRGVSLHGAVLTLGMYHSNADAQRELQCLLPLLPTESCTFPWDSLGSCVSPTLPRRDDHGRE